MCLNGIENNYNADINTLAASSKGLSLINSFDEHRKANITLATTHSGSLKGQYFAISNDFVFTDIPVISLYFDETEVYKMSRIGI